MFAPKVNADTFVFIELLCLLFCFSDPPCFRRSHLSFLANISASDSSALSFSLHLSLFSPFVDHKLLVILPIFVQYMVWDQKFRGSLFIFILIYLAPEPPQGRAEVSRGCRASLAPGVPAGHSRTGIRLSDALCSLLLRKTTWRQRLSLAVTPGPQLTPPKGS